MRLATTMMLVGACGGAATSSPGWTPAIAHSASAPGTPVAVPFPDGTIGTELVLSVLAQARQAGAVALTDIQLQVGRCVRDISYDGAPALVDPVTFVTTESDLHCSRSVDLYITDAPAEGYKFHAYGFRETEMREHEDCQTRTVTRAVTRERSDMQHRFVPPRWDMIEAWTRLPLRPGPVHCDAPSERNELRMRVFTAGAIPADPRMPPPPVPTAAAIKDAVARGDGAAALELWHKGRFESGQPPDVADAVAHAAFLVVDVDAARLIASPIPDDHGAAWMDAVDAQLADLAKRYAHIGEIVLGPPAKPWLAAGARRLAAAHTHLAELYDQLGREAAAAKQRQIAAELSKL